jgi:hypothetical protein
LIDEVFKINQLSQTFISAIFQQGLLNITRKANPMQNISYDVMSMGFAPGYSFYLTDKTKPVLSIKYGNCGLSNYRHGKSHFKIWWLDDKVS